MTPVRWHFKEIFFPFPQRKRVHSSLQLNDVSKRFAAGALSIISAATLVNLDTEIRAGHNMSTAEFVCCLILADVFNCRCLLVLTVFSTA